MDNCLVWVEHPDGERSMPWNYCFTVFHLEKDGKEVGQISFPCAEGDEIRWYKKLSEDKSYWPQ